MFVLKAKDPNQHKPYISLCDENFLSAYKLTRTAISIQTCSNYRQNLVHKFEKQLHLDRLQTKLF